MSGRLLRRRGTSTEHANFTGLVGEFTYDTTNKRIIAHDGATAGGVPAAKLSEVVTARRTEVADAPYTILTSDRIVGYSSLTEAREVALPAASLYPVGVPLWIIDESGSCSQTNTITANRAGTDTIDGAPSAVLDGPYGTMCLASNGLNKWTLIAGEPNLSPTMIGINTAPDSINKLACRTSAALFDNVGNGVQIKVNKNASGDIASFLFQTGFSGHAEIGLIGDNDFHFKSSPDGLSFYDVIVLSSTSGLMTLPFGQIKFPAAQNASSDSNTLDDYQEGMWSPILQFGGGSTGITYATQTGRYTKIGNRVFLTAQIMLSAKGSPTGNATITGLPFNQVSSTPTMHGSMVVTHYFNLASITGYLTGFIGSGESTATLRLGGATGTTDLTDTNFTNTSQLQLEMIMTTE
jgi:hypothetical protein